MLRELKGAKILVNICGNVQKDENMVVFTDSDLGTPYSLDHWVGVHPTNCVNLLKGAK